MSTESDTPRTDALMPDQVYKRTMYEHILVMEAHSRQLERELNEVTKQRDGLHELHNKNAARSAEILELCQTMRQQRNALDEALRKMLKFTPRSLSCQDFHHAAKDQHRESDDCQPTKRFREAWAEAEQALATTKREKP